MLQWALFIFVLLVLASLGVSLLPVAWVSASLDRVTAWWFRMRMDERRAREQMVIDVDDFIVLHPIPPSRQPLKDAA